MKASLVHKVLQAQQGEAPHPALLMLHGYGSNEDDLPSLASELDPRFFVISVQAPFELMPGAYQWYAIQGIGQPEKTQFTESISRLQAFLDEALAAYPIDPQRLFLLGFSQGAMMSGALTLAQPEKITGTIMLSGYLPELDGDTEKLHRKPFFVAHGTADNVLPISIGRKVPEYLNSLGADVTYKEYPMLHQVSFEEIEDLNDWLKPRL